MTWGVNDYPCKNAVPNADCLWTPGSPGRQCTSFSRWRVRKDLGILLPNLGSGGDFGPRAKALGYAVDGNARLHDLICYPPGVQGSDRENGHVCVLWNMDGGVFTVEEYNFDVEFGYTNNRVIDHTAGLQFIHIAPFVQPPSPATEENPMLAFFVAKTSTAGPGKGANGVFQTNGMTFRHMRNAQNYLDVQHTGPWLNGDGKPLPMWNEALPVADVYAFGVPADAETATELGLPFP